MTKSIAIVAAATALAIAASSSTVSAQSQPFTCICSNGPDKGKVTGASVIVGVESSVCNNYFATNVTPTALPPPPTLGGGAEATATLVTATVTLSATGKSGALSNGAGVQRLSFLGVVGALVFGL
ncbi:hypothetical protein HDV05_000764 [Chytridiales sp. JEL 0842]|nr:hypothetical protein HDV05_000764 [Chytridiales sp. JEL 0842]